MIQEIDAPTLEQWLQSGDAILIDVREPDEFASGHIEGAVSIPLSVFPQTYNHGHYPADKKIVFQCKAGGRSMRACQLVCDIAANEDNVFNLAGGIGAWVSSGREVVS
ncbi:MAG: rhodanese-like domain-containing protein [Alphaproteobacteria bacterium]|nr:rhodanese-like domain-containing protein [Alphaproteobacteria bacterium]MCB1551453.1 rhodanese-like domain-containing protein [Alphaproteobacteria bacterium]MCB9984465.1 rhodanese-like domain-containing protein [Micavibrio sp.]HPQ51036.1 rhodanese-like domain-containing protein [Alphaproteobacteria bacterium]